MRRCRVTFRRALDHENSTAVICSAENYHYGSYFKKGALDSDFMFVNIEPYKSKKCVPY